MTTTSTPSADVPRQRFALTRFHAVTSLVGIVVVTACLLWTYRVLTDRQLVEHESQSNADMASVLANSIWDDFRGFVMQPPSRQHDALVASPAFAQLRTEVLRRMRHLDVVKVKVYSLDGLTVFSTDARQTGEVKSANPGFRRAAAGEVASELVFREKFDAFEGTLSNRDLIASYVPIRAASGAVEGVFEVYSDVTSLLARQRRAQWEVAAIVVPLLCLLYLFLIVAARKADRIIATHEAAREAREAQVRHQAFHDALTGLPNRACFAQRLAEVVAAAAAGHHRAAVMFVDLDRFKIVNDSLGHEAGDRLLRAVAERLSRCLRESDLLFRMGGDEFTVILPRVEGDDDATQVARRVLDAMVLPVPIDAHELVVGATVGIALYPEDGTRHDVLLKNADAAMYSAKAAGRGTFAFYRAQMNQKALERVDLEAALHKGFRAGEFTLFYQPRYAGARDGRVVGLEALLRWVSPARGVVLPEQFLPVLEETGMMTIVGEWVLRSACAQARRLADAGTPTRVSVNVSAVQFGAAAFLPMVERVLRDTRVPAALVELELPEALVSRDLAHARQTIAALKQLGLRVAIDDFGTGYASLAYLREVQVDCVKIERRFVMDVTRSDRDRAVATALVDLARALGVDVVAEGVETRAQAAFFRHAQCVELQGFHLCRPMPADRVAAFLAGGPVAEGAVGAPGPVAT